MHARSIAALKKAALLLPVLLVCGCGGGGELPDHPGPGPGPIDPPIDEKEMLRAEGLIVSLEGDKVVFQKGEEIRVWFAVRNEGSRARTLELHPVYDTPGAYTYTGGMSYWRLVGDPPERWWFGSYDLISKEVPPGETIRLVELVWDQVKDDGTPAKAGYYDAWISVHNLYVDGRKLAEIPTFGVSLFGVIQIQE